MRRYLLKEYGSWGVMTLSFLTGILVSKALSAKLIPAFIAVSLLINSKQVLTLWSRRSGSEKTRVVSVFFAQVGLATAILLFILAGSVTKLLPFASVPLAYIFLNRLLGEHSIYTETAGFSSLSMASLVAKFICTGQVDLRLYISAAVFFCAGVLKVRLQLRKGPAERSAMFLYVIFAVCVYYLIKAPLFALLPLAENLMFALSPYKMKLRATGWTEVIKGVVFLLLMYLLY